MEGGGGITIELTPMSQAGVEIRGNGQSAHVDPDIAASWWVMS